jgi:hypothetical protein
MMYPDSHLLKLTYRYINSLVLSTCILLSKFSNRPFSTITKCFMIVVGVMIDTVKWILVIKLKI